MLCGLNDQKLSLSANAELADARMLQMLESSECAGIIPNLLGIRMLSTLGGYYAHHWIENTQWCGGRVKKK